VPRTHKLPRDDTDYYVHKKQTHYIIRREPSSELPFTIIEDNCSSPEGYKEPYPQEATPSHVADGVETPVSSWANINRPVLGRGSKAYGWSPGQHYILRLPFFRLLERFESRHRHEQPK
jgi:hypothetical protein